MMTLEQIIEITQPSLVSGSHCVPSGKITDNSRQVESGDVFVAVRGNAFDGHKFIPQAIQLGASVIISEEIVETEECCVLVVSDTREILAPLALAWFGNPQSSLKLLGITGTNGKTTTATLIWQALTRLGHTAALLGTVTKRFGDLEEKSALTTPGAVELAKDLRQAADTGCTHFVMEVSSHALDQKRTRGLQFDVAVFTNLSHDHLDYHKSVEAYVTAKKSLFDDLTPDAFAIVNTDDIVGNRMVSDTRATVWEVNLTSDDYRVLTMDADGLVLNMDGVYIKSRLTGTFNAYNIAEAWLSLVALGISPKNAAASLEDCNGAPGRLENVSLELIENGRPLPAVFVDYAHTPDALENVLKTLQEIRQKGQEIHTVFGCGGDRDRQKRPEMARIAARYSNRITVTSDNPRHENPETIIDEICEGFPENTLFDRITDRKVAIEQVIRSSDANTIVLVAGKGHEDYQEIKGNRYPMDDRKISQDALRTWKVPINRKENV